MVDSVFNPQHIGYHQYDLRVAYGINRDAHCVRNPKSHRGHFFRKPNSRPRLITARPPSGRGSRLTQTQRNHMKRNRIIPATLLATLLTALVAAAIVWPPATAQEPQPPAPSRLCVVWSSADAGVAKNVCFMYTHNAKKQGWFDEVYLVVWGPSAKLLAENQELQAEVKAMQTDGVVTEACVACARRYEVDDDLQELDVQVYGMGKPLSQRLQGDWEVITF